ncbi:MAG: NAD(P)H-dependent oxidoreductase subunit E, partial [Nitrospirota bacterium]
MFSEERIKELREHVASLEHPEEALVDLMHEAQKAYGYLSDEAEEVVAGIAGVPVIKVDEIATF